MALTAGRPPTTMTFVRLKLRLVANGLRGNGRQVTTFVLGCLFGFAYAIGGAVGFIATGFASTRTATGFAGVATTVIVLGWLVIPSLFFGVDETLDPARFALMPLPKRRLITGMAAAALTGIPAVATMIVFVGSVLGAIAHRGLLAGVIALFGAALTVLFCVTGSRAITSALATALRSRRTRDIASVVLAVLAASIGPLQIVGVNLLTRTSSGPLVHVLRVLAWTPLAGGSLAAYDTSPLISLARLGVVAAGIVAMAWWWSSSLEEAMIGTASGGSRARASGAKAVGSFVPWVLRGLRPSPFVGIVARELRYWFRDPRRRAALISVAITGIVMPIVLRLNDHGDTHFGPPVSATAAFSGLVGGVLMMQVFSFDGSAYAGHLLVGIRARIEIGARAVAIGLLVGSTIAVVTTGVCMVTGQVPDLPVALGTGLGAFGCSLGVASMLAVAASFPMPESRNMFAMNTGSGASKGLLSLVVLLGAGIVSLPLDIAAFFVPSGVELVLGIGWGSAVTFAGVAIGARRLADHGPELLLTITPRR